MSNDFSNIYRKHCPECMAVAPQDQPACTCGHRFDAHDNDSVEQERLYEAYLAARLKQAGQALAVAQKARELHPDDAAKKAELAAAKREWESVQAELNAQCERTRVAEAAKAAAPAPKKSPPQSPDAQSGSQQPFVHPAPRLIPRAVQGAKQAPSARDRGAMAGVSAKTAAADKPRSSARGSVSMSPEIAERYPSLYQAFLKRSGDQDKVAAGAPSAAADKGRPTNAAKAPAVRATRECPHCTAVLPLAATHCKCGVTFAQQGQVTEIPALTAASAPAPEQTPTQSRGTKECPHCTAVLPASAMVCRCGMKFHANDAATVMPGLPISDEDIRLLKELYRK